MRFRHTIYLPTAVFISYFVLWPPGVRLLRPDSPQYIDFDPIRSAGYPLFLDLVTCVMGSIDYVPYVQLVLYAAAALFLAREVLQSTRLLVVALPFHIMLLLNPRINSLIFQVITEPLFVCLLMFSLGAILRIARLPSLRWMAVLSALVGVAATLRPSAASLLPILPIVWVLFWPKLAGRRVVAAIVLVLPAALAMTAETLRYHSVHGAERLSLIGIHAFAKAGMINSTQVWSEADLADLSNGERQLFDSLGEDLQPMRDIIWLAEPLGLRRHIASSYETYLEYFYRPDLRDQLVAEHGGDQFAVGASFRKIGFRRLSAELPEYIRLTALHYAGLWSGFYLRTPRGARINREFLRESRPLPFEDELSRVLFLREPNVLAIPMNIGIPATGMITALAIIWFLVLWVRGRSPGQWLLVATLASMIIHGNFLLTAMFGIANPRYTVAMWPAALLALTLLLMHGTGVFRERRDSRRA